ncbi:MAG: hypothetical protein ABFR82_17995, partial [Nitrospirota bacterium]
MEERIIHPYSEKKSITKELSEKALEPYEQQTELYSALKSWSSHAVGILKAKGYTEFLAYGGTYKLVWHPMPIESDDNKVNDADAVLRAIHNLHDAIFQDDKNQIANAGIQIGIAVGKAHAELFEKLAISGKKRKEHSKVMLDERHKENREKKTLALTYYRSNKRKW